MFDTSGFVPRWSCGDWSQPLGWLHIGSDLLIFLAYFAIPIALAVVMIRRRDLPFGALLALFVAFILACGATHLIRELPSLLALPGLQRVINDLRAALAREEHTRQELAAVRDTVERRSSEMTLRLRRIAASLSSARAVACRWQAQSGAVDWEVGFAESCRQAGLAHHQPFSGFRELLIPDDAERLQREVDDAIRSGAPIDFEGAIGTTPTRSIRLAASLEPEVEGQPRYMTGMFRIL
jgi:hypothetical protein